MFNVIKVQKEILLESHNESRLYREGLLSKVSKDIQNNTY